MDGQRRDRVMEVHGLYRAGSEGVSSAGAYQHQGEGLFARGCCASISKSISSLSPGSPASLPQEK